MRVVRRAFGADGSHFSVASVGRQPEAQLQALRGILRRALSDSSQFDCSSERSGVNLGVARVVRAVAHGAGSPRRAGTALPSSPLHGGTTSCVQVVRGRAAAAQAPSAHGLGPVRVRRAVAAVRAVPFGPRAAGCAPHPLGLESSGRAAPLPVRDECGFQCAPQPRTAECCKVETVARAHGAPRQFTETIIDVQLCLLLSSYIILCGSATCAVGPRMGRSRVGCFTTRVGPSAGPARRCGGTCRSVWCPSGRLRASPIGGGEQRARSASPCYG